MKPTFQVKTNTGQMVNLEDKKFPELILQMSEYSLSITRFFTETRFSKQTLEENVKKAVDGFFGKPDFKIEVERQRWMLIVDEFIKNFKCERPSKIVLTHRKLDLKILLIEKK